MINLCSQSPSFVHLEGDFRPKLTHFDEWMALQGKIFRSVKDRQTHQIMLDGQSIFIKKHYGVGWAEILKNLLSLKWPILGARNEWQAINKLNEIGIATTPLLAYGERGSNPAHRQSFVVTRDLGDIVTLETLCASWLIRQPSPTFKRKLILKVAELACRFHANGMWHRDFYLCHFALQSSSLHTQDLRLHLMDLHRVEIYNQLPMRRRLKDLAGLYFSALHIGLTRRDVLRFLKVYFQMPLRQVLKQHSFLQMVAHRAKQLDKKFQRKSQAGVAM